MMREVNETKAILSNKEGVHMIYCTGDLHGMPLENLQSLLKKANFGDKDFLFILGDVIDRGEHGVDILKWLLVQPNVELILGNHEAMLLSCEFLFDEITEDSLADFGVEKMERLSTWMSNGAQTTLKALRKLNNERPDLCADILDYLKDAPLYETVSTGDNDFLLCHSGFENFDKNKRLSDYTPDEWLWSRPALDSVFFEDRITVFGHTPTGYYGREYAGKVIKTESWINIDTGDTTSLLRLDDLKAFYL